MKGITITREVDVRGSFCPPPLMEMIRIIKCAEVGDVVAVLANDEESAELIPLWLRKVREEFLGTEPADGAVRYIARRVR